ncbi:MAG: hypothetical protein V8R46_01055 [Eubacterium ramulus]
MKDEYGDYRIPIERQRNRYFCLARRVSEKSAVMEQIAQEMDIALVSDSMTHHTRREVRLGSCRLSVTKTMAEQSL